MSRLEFAILVGACLAGSFIPWTGWTRRLSAIAGRRWWAVFCVFVTATLLNAGFVLIKPPVPQVHDEFANLLATDTFLHRRLANPTHPLWPHFETFYVLHEPAYASMYPPAQGLWLAAGNWIAGAPAAGICLGAGLAAAAVCWMLQGWLPPKWALLGGLLLAFHSYFQWNWCNYWNGYPATLGGALLFGGWGRFRNTPTPWNSALMALGAVILCFSRPFEGFVVCVPVACAVVISAARSPSSKQQIVNLLPGAVVLAAGAAMLAGYNAALTGRASRMPAAEWGRRYTARPLFLWQDRRTAPNSTHDVLQSYADRYSEWEESQSLKGFARVKSRQFLELWTFFLGASLTIPLIALRWTWRLPGMPTVLLSIGLLAAASCNIAWLQPHYWAPALPLIVLTCLQGMRHWRVATRSAAHGVRALLPCIVVAFFVWHGVRLTMQVSAPEPENWARHRQQIQQQLEASGSKHLVIVRYDAAHPFHDEWVYNAAGIDGSAVVWARDMQDKNQRLLDYYDNREVWLLEADRDPPTLEPYSNVPTQSQPSPTPLRASRFRRRADDQRVRRRSSK